MDLLLQNKKVLISGSTSGIGYAIAKCFAKEGAVVYINGRNDERVRIARSNIMEEVVDNNQVFGIVADISTDEGYLKLISELPEIDILINNMGIYEPLSFFESNDEDWLKLFNMNVMTGIRLSRFYMPKMLKKNSGRIVFISSESGLQIPTEMIHYGMSKTAQISIANGLAQLTKGTNVTVNSILPGPTYSDGVQRYIEELAQQSNAPVKDVEQQFFSQTRPLSLLQRFITTEEVANTVAYISSPLAAATNGATVRVDGGILKGLQ